MAGVNGKIVKAIIQRDMGLFIKRVIILVREDFWIGNDCYSGLIRELIFRLFKQEIINQLQETIDPLFPFHLFKGYGILSVRKFG